MSDAQKLIAKVLRLSQRCRPSACDCGTCTAIWADRAAVEIDKALGGLGRAWAAVLPDDSYFGPYHEAHEISRNEARMQAEADVAEYEDSALKSRWVSGWSEVDA